MSESQKKIRVLVVDDSALMRATIRQLLSADSGIEVLDAAGSGPVALSKIQQLQPDVITLDVEMPGMDGIEVLRRVMADSPTPVVMLSAHTQDGAHRTLEALEAGAIDYVHKPTGAAGAGLREVSATLIQKIREASLANMHGAWKLSARAAAAESRVQPSVPSTPRAAPSAANGDRFPIIVIGISCGGPATLAEVFPEFPPDSPPILITQHMPPGFTNSFAQRLDRLSCLSVKEGAADDPVVPGRAYVAPGDAHMTIAGTPGRLRLALDRRGPVCGHMPSVDVLLRSAAKMCGARTVAAIMTGMGNDGAEALGTIAAAGGITVAQDQESCIVFGMPKAAIEMGNAQHVVPLERIVSTLIELSRQIAGRSPAMAGA